ncbi:hypothetical protein AURDEDRAFT_151071 [Auricularia subglabra TFB-10046 SS5]|nr:hypothetical protein AURDEDRAFT_151071 [Auricularia subglabra TFB-10046 SS5]
MSSVLSHLQVLFSGLADIMSVAAGLGAEAATMVIDGLSAHVRDLQALLDTDQGLSVYLSTPPSYHPSGREVSVDSCNQVVRIALHAVARVVASLEYVQRNFRQHLASNSSTDRSSTASFQNASVAASSTTRVHDALLGQPLAETSAYASARRQALSYTPSTSLSGTAERTRLLRNSRTAWKPWTGSLEPPPFPRPLVGRHDADVLELLQNLLAGEKTVGGFLALVNSGEAWQAASSRMTELYCLGGSSDVAAANIPTASMLYEAAPNLARLSINSPIAPSSSEPGLAPDLRYLCIDEANGVVWSQNRTADTLDALHAEDVVELHLRNTLPATLRKCAEYLNGISSCIVVDNGDTRYINLVDRHHSHAYTGGFIARTNFLFKTQMLAEITTLTLCEKMTADELRLLFDKGFPRGLEELRLWYGAEYRSLETRTPLLKYRTHGWARCTALRTLVLTATRPLDDIPARRALPRAAEPQSLIAEFL